MGPVENGIHMDICCAAKIMPVSCLPQFEVETGKNRQRYVGAAGKIVNSKGQKKIEFMTRKGQGRSMHDVPDCGRERNPRMRCHGV